MTGRHSGAVVSVARRSEMQEEEGVHIFTVPGAVLRTGLKDSWLAPGPGWCQVTMSMTRHEDNDSDRQDK